MGTPGKDDTAPIQYSLNGLSYSYESGHIALDKVSLEIPGPGVVTFMGPSGAGKSTLLKCLAGSVIPSSGEITLNMAGPVKDIKSHCAIIWQDSGLVDRLSALENVLIGDLNRFSVLNASIKKFSENEKLKALKLLDHLGLAEKSARQVRNLSGGERQRVAIARAFYKDAQIILADEPIASLDPKLALEVMIELVTLAQTQNKLLILSLHQPEIAIEYSDRVIGVQDGSIVFDKPTTEMSSNSLDQLYQTRLNPVPKSSVDTTHHEPSLSSNVLRDKITKWPNLSKSQFAVVLFVILLVGYSFDQTDTSLIGVFNGIPQMGDFISELFPPEFEMEEKEFPIFSAISFQLPRVVWVTWETILMAISGTTIGGLFAMPFALLGARNICRSKLVYWMTRAFLNANRAIPDIVYALIMVSAVGLGPFAGTLALAVGSIGSMAKVFSEVIESANKRPVESLEVTGANKWLIFRFAILPQALPMMSSYFILYFEHNVRSATILGLVGAGGIGFVISEYYQLFQYQKLCSAIMLIIIAVSLLDKLSDSIRKRII